MTANLTGSAAAARRAIDSSDRPARGGLGHGIMTAGVEALARFPRPQLLRQLRLRLLERDQQVLLQRFPLGEILLEAFGTGRRHAALPLLGRRAALLHAGVLAPQFLGQALRVAQLVVDITLQSLDRATASAIRTLLAGGSVLTLRAWLRLSTRGT
jgi:hypothetical protein